MILANKRDWYEKFVECLWTYITTVRTPAMPHHYPIVYWSEAILMLEIQIPSLHTALVMIMTTEENHQRQLDELEALHEKRLQTQQYIELYQSRISTVFNKKAKKESFAMKI